MTGIRLFSLFKIPIHVTGGFLLLAAFYGYSLRHAGPPAIFAWITAVFISILVHELGHAVVAKRYQLKPAIFLHGFGGLTAHQPAPGPRQDALIIAAGPATGLILGGLSYAAATWFPSLVLQGPFTNYLMNFLIFINIWWSLINLLPVFPLDGGQLFRLGAFKLIRDPAKAHRLVHYTAILICGAGILYGLSQSQILIGIISVFILFENIKFLQANPQAIRPHQRDPAVDQLIIQARQAISQTDFQEAARLAHLARANPKISDSQSQDAIEVLAVTHANQGEWEEAYTWLRGSAPTPLSIELLIMSLAGMGRHEEARGLADASNLGAAARQRITARTGLNLS